MKTVSYSEARKNLAKLLDGVQNTSEPVIITKRSKTQKTDRNMPVTHAVVLVSVDDYNHMARCCQTLTNL